MAFAAAALFVSGCSPKGGEAAAVVESADNAVPAEATAASSWSVFDLNSAFTDQDGVKVDLRDVAGKQSVIAFIYTNCTATCPLIVGALKRIEAELSADELRDTRFLLVSLDPDRDTPGRLSEWARGTGLDESRWRLLVGDNATLRELAATLDARYQILENGEIAHTNGFTIIDVEGRVIHHQPGYQDIDDALKTIHTRR